MAEKTSLLFPLTLPVPGSAGFTEEKSLSGDVDQWLFEALNAIYTKDGLLAPREHWRGIGGNSTGLPAGIANNEFYPTYAGSRYFVSVNKKIYTHLGFDLFSAGFLLETGMEAPTAPTITKHWKAVYLGAADDERGTYFFASGEKPKYWSGDFFFSQITNGPQYGIAHAAFGRIWATDGYTLAWSQLLDGSTWTGTGTGSLNLRVHLGQNEAATAIADFNNFLVVFTNRSVLIYENPFNVPVDVSGTVGDGGNLNLKEKIDGTGCVGLNAWCSIGEELFFVAYNGLYRMSRIMSDGGSNPLGVVCPQINHSIMESLNTYTFTTESISYVRLNYHPLFGFLTLETPSIYHGVFLIWLTRPIGNNSYAVTQWGIVPRDRMLGTDTGTMYQTNTSLYGLYSAGITFSSTQRSILAVVICRNNVGQPEGFAGVASYGLTLPSRVNDPVIEPTFEFRIKGAWLTFGAAADPVEKMPKDLKIIYRMPRNPDTSGGALEWADYVPTPLPVKYILRYDYSEDKYEHNFVASLDDIAVNQSYRNKFPSHYEIMPVPLTGSGNLVQWEIVANITDIAHESFAIQRVGLQSKLGRINQGI